MHSEHLDDMALRIVQLELLLDTVEAHLSQMARGEHLSFKSLAHLLEQVRRVRDEKPPAN